METRPDTQPNIKGARSGYSSLTPSLSIRDVPKFLDFLSRAFGAKEQSRFVGEDGAIMHAEVLVGNSRLMVGEVNEKDSPVTGGFYLYVENADESYAQAISAGSESVMPPTNQFYGDRGGAVRDAWGNFWFIATHIEDVPEDQLLARSKASMR